MCHEKNESLVEQDLAMSAALAKVGDLTRENTMLKEWQMPESTASTIRELEERIERLSRELDEARKVASIQTVEQLAKAIKTDVHGDTTAFSAAYDAVEYLKANAAQAPAQPETVTGGTVTTELDKVQRWQLTQTKPGIFRHCNGMWIDRDCAMYAAKEDQAAAVKAARKADGLAFARERAKWDGRLSHANQVISSLREALNGMRAERDDRDKRIAELEADAENWKKPPKTMRVREAARKRFSLGGPDCQALEGAITLTEREPRHARAENETLKVYVRNAQESAKLECSRADANAKAARELRELRLLFQKCVRGFTWSYALSEERSRLKSLLHLDQPAAKPEKREPCDSCADQLNGGSCECAKTEGDGDWTAYVTGEG